MRAPPTADALRLKYAGISKESRFGSLVKLDNQRKSNSCDTALPVLTIGKA